MAEITTRFYGKVASLGADKVIDCRATLTAFTQASGPLYQALTSAIAILDTVSLISGQIMGLYLKALNSGIYYNPVGTAVATAACGFVSANNWNYWTVQSGMSVVPAARAQLSSAVAEIWYFGTT